jgi:hypothetical protein
LWRCRALGAGGSLARGIIYMTKAAPSDRYESRQAGRSEAAIIRADISDAMVMAGIGALCEWEDRREAGQTVTDRDLVCAIYAAMRRSLETAADSQRQKQDCSSARN